MWSDNETKTDLIGFKVHSDLVLSVVTDDTMLGRLAGLDATDTAAAGSVFIVKVV